MPIVRPSTSSCGVPPPNCGLATQEPARNAVTDSNRRWLKASMVMITYSAMAGSWPNVANRHTFRDRLGVEQIEPGRHGLKQAKARCGRERGPGGGARRLRFVRSPVACGRI